MRLAGYGHPTAFLLDAKESDGSTLTDNPKFGWRFFPPAIARAPRPLYLTRQKAPGTVRIFVFGESAAMGDPEPAYGLARQLERLLQERHPDQRIEVINAAMTAINSHVIREIARDCSNCEADFWLVYAGNNEVIGPFGAGTIFGRQAPGLRTVRAILALKRTRIGQLLSQLTRRADEPKQWEGLEFFLRSQVPRDSPLLERVYTTFAANLSDIADLGKQSGATVMLSTIHVNLRDFPPLASVHRADLSHDQLAYWEKSFSTGTQAQIEGRFEDALPFFRKASDIDDGFAQLVFERATCEVELRQAGAANDFRAARDLDALRFRADSRINDIIRQTAKAHGVLVSDADQEFAHFKDETLFYDHVHLNFRGNYLLATLFAAELEKHWPGAQTKNSAWLSESEVARRLAYTGFDQRRVGEEMRARLQQPPFNAQSNFGNRDKRWSTTLANLSAPMDGCISNYDAAIALAPNDWMLRANFARLLATVGESAGAAREWAEVSRLLPHSSEGWANQGRFARLKGDTVGAKTFLATALKQNPDSVETRAELGNLEADLGEKENARREFRSALSLQPGFAAARVSLGLLMAQEGDFAGAAKEYREVLRWNTNNVEARINLANLLLSHGQQGEASTLYQQAVDLDPNNPIARYNFGRLLAMMNRNAEALTNFEIASSHRPDSGEIHFELGNALAHVGREKEALAEFAQAVRLKPDLADAHLNYGVALARSGRYPEAATEFQETLRLRPQDQRAQLMLKQALRSPPGDGGVP